MSEQRYLSRWSVRTMGKSLLVQGVVEASTGVTLGVMKGSASSPGIVGFKPS